VPHGHSATSRLPVGRAPAIKTVWKGKRRAFKDMVKYVVDVRTRVVAIGGDLHADAEQLLLAQGSRQADLWGANHYPGRGRPSQGNGGMEVADEGIRQAMRDATYSLIGEGEAL